MAEKHVTSQWNTVWIQRNGPNTKPEFLTCYAIPTITDPKGAITRTKCFDPATNQWITVGDRVSPPDDPTLSLDGLTSKTADLIELAERTGCPFALYVNSYECPPRNVFLGFDRGKVIEYARIETETENGLTARDDAVDTTLGFDLSGEKIEKYFSCTLDRLTIADTNPARDIAFCNQLQCQGPCGEYKPLCNDGIIVCNAAALGIANVYYTQDGGITWTVTTAQPFIADEHIASVVCFPIAKGVTRWIVARGTTDGANEAEVAYSDDLGDTWTTVEQGSTVGEYYLHSGSLFALDMQHIWAASNLGNIYFSSDGGVTWTEQTQPNTVPLNYIRFCDFNVGVAVGGATGASQVILTTTDGGAHWTEGSFANGGPAATVMAYCVEVLDKNRFFVGFENGALYYTRDGGATWAERTVATPAGMLSTGAIYDIMRVPGDDFCLWICTLWEDGQSNYYGSVQRSVNGGYDWDVWTTVALDDDSCGLYAIWACSFNQAFSVGNTETTAMVVEVSD